MAGANAFDTEKIFRLMVIGVFLIVILIAAGLGMFVVTTFSGGNAGSSGSSGTGTSGIGVADPVTTNPAYDPSNPANPAYDPSNPSYPHNPATGPSYVPPTGEPASNVTDTSIDDSVKEIPIYGPSKVNTLSANSPKENGNISLGYYQLLFEKKYDYRKMMGNTSLLVNVNRGPLVVHYEISNPTVTMSTTGKVESKELDKKYQGNYEDKGKTIEGLPNENPNYCYAGINIMDAATGRIVASNAFGMNDSSETKKDVTVYANGEYLVNCYGTGLEVDIKVITGATEDNPNAVAVDTSAKDAFSSLTLSGTKTVKSGSGSSTSYYDEDESIPPWERR